MIGERAHKGEKQVYDYLCERFGREFVHREYFFTDDARTRADFFIYDKSGNFCIDIFYPSTYRNLSGCLNSKLDKYSEARMREYPVIFLQMNPEITQREVDLLASRKEKKLLPGQQLLCWEPFLSFTETRAGLKIA